MAKTFQERTIKDLHERLAAIQAECDLLRDRIGHLERFLAKVLLEAQSAQNQIKYIGGAPDQQMEAKIE